MDFLLASTLIGYREAGVVQASLAIVPREDSDTAEWFVPTRTLRAFKQKFSPRWGPPFLALPLTRQRLLAIAAIGRAYGTHGLCRALSRNR